MLRSWMVILVFAVSTARGENLRLYLGTGSSAIHLTEFDTDAGSFGALKTVAKTQRPTFLWIHDHTLFNICEVKRGEVQQGAAIESWRIDSSTGELTKISRQDAMGDGPCFVAVSKSGKYAAIANYGGGSTSLFPVSEDGSLSAASGHVQHTGSSINSRRQEAPHAHISRFDPDDQRVVVADLGTDKVYLYDIDSVGRLSSSNPAHIDMSPGSGPRHLVFSPDKKHLLVLGELSGTITSVRYSPPSTDIIQTVSTMDADTPKDAPRGSAEILFHPNGKWVYCSNRGPNQIAVFDYDAPTGKLTRTSAVSCGGKHPRNFRFAPDGRFLLVANQQSNEIVVFRVDPLTGSLQQTSAKLAVDKPMCLKFLR